jgi:chromosome segregation ATPase
MVKRAHQEADLQDLGSIDDPSKYFELMSQLRPFTGKAAHQLLTEKESAFRRAAIRKRQIKIDMDQIKDRVRTDYRAEISQVERNLEKVLGQLRDVERALTDAQTHRTEADATLQRLQAQNQTASLRQSRSRDTAALFEGLREIFSGAVEEFEAAVTCRGPARSDRNSPGHYSRPRVHRSHH